MTQEELMERMRLFGSAIQINGDVKQLNMGDGVYNDYGNSRNGNGIQDDDNLKTCKPGRKQSADISEVTHLAELINPIHLEKFKKVFNNEIVPHLVSASPSFDPMEVCDMEFEFVKDTYKTDGAYSKGDMYKSFSTMSYYLKDGFGKEQLADYMNLHIAGMPKAESILRKI